MKKNNQILCGKCKFYFVTYEKYKPWGCSKFGFKSSILPSQLVFNTTGTNCAYFVKKVNLKDQKEQPVRNVRMT